MTVTANGELHHLEGPTPLPSFLNKLGLALEHVVVEHNQQALTPGKARTTTLKEGDQLEIVKIVAGG